MNYSNNLELIFSYMLVKLSRLVKTNKEGSQVTLAQLQLARSGVGAASEIFQGIASSRRLNAVVVVGNTFAGATGDRCCATTLETLETRVTVRVIVAVT